MLISGVEIGVCIPTNDAISKPETTVFLCQGDQVITKSKEM